MKSYARNTINLSCAKILLTSVINEEDAVLIPKKSRRDLYQRILVLAIFWDGVSPYAATPLIVALSPGHSDINMVTNRDRKSFGWRRKNSKFAQTTSTV